MNYTIIAKRSYYSAWRTNWGGAQTGIYNISYNSASTTGAICWKAFLRFNNFELFCNDANKNIQQFFPGLRGLFGEMDPKSLHKIIQKNIICQLFKELQWMNEFI